MTSNQKPYVVGCIHGNVTPQQAVVSFATLTEAENWIDEQQSVDPKGVDKGEYYIDGPEQDHPWRG